MKIPYIRAIDTKVAISLMDDSTGYLYDFSRNGFYADASNILKEMDDATGSAYNFPSTYGYLSIATLPVLTNFASIVFFHEINNTGTFDGYGSGVARTEDFIYVYGLNSSDIAEVQRANVSSYPPEQNRFSKSSNGALYFRLT